MADVPRTQSELLTLFADNTAGDISAQDGRDFIVSTYQPQMVLPGGRLTLTTGVPVTTTDVTGATTIYYTSYLHNGIGLYDGTSWKLYSFTERSLALGTLTSGLNYDVFLYDNAGTLTLELTAWTNDTTRATALVLQDGVWVKTGALTRRYLGTIRTTATTTTEDSDARRFVFNAYNRTRRKLQKVESTASWTYASATWRQARASAANQVEAVLGLAGLVDVAIVGLLYSSSVADQNGFAGIGEDSTSALSANSFGGQSLTPAVNDIVSINARYENTVAAGYHYWAWIEKTAAAGTNTFYGSSSGDRYTGLSGGLQA